MTQNVVLETINLTKRYAGTRGHPGRLALNRLSLTVQRGEIFGYLGPNGAGKTTTIRLMLDLIRPTEGSVRFSGWTRTATPSASSGWSAICRARCVCGIT